jgi:hypothetical protein
MMRSDVVNAVLEKECEAIVLTDSSKFGAVHPYTMGPASRFSRVITDERLSEAHRNKLEESGLIVDIIKTRLTSAPEFRAHTSFSEMILNPALRVFTCLTCIKVVKLILAI